MTGNGAISDLLECNIFLHRFSFEKTQETEVFQGARNRPKTYLGYGYSNYGEQISSIGPTKTCRYEVMILYHSLFKKDNWNIEIIQIAKLSSRA